MGSEVELLSQKLRMEVKVLVKDLKIHTADFRDSFQYSDCIKIKNFMKLNA